ncbi:MAG: PIN domain-containing protein [Euryarchaeota archaeon]|nr:PIN domain-containing protein [Euryarchaeota archaeon]
MAVLIDANVIVSFLLQSGKVDEAKDILRAVDDPVTILNVLEEVVYVGLSIINDSRGFRLRDQVRKGLNDDSRFFLRHLRSFVDDFRIRLVQPPDDLDLLFHTIDKYGLLPNDALIAATCQHYGIIRIATFDSDFRRVDYLEIVKA